MNSKKSRHLQAKKRLALSIVVGACFLANLAIPSKAEAAQCKKKVGAYSISATKSLARKQARMVWRGLVAQRYGPDYVIWRLGKDRSSSCRRHKWVLYRCTVRAKPCR